MMELNIGNISTIATTIWVTIIAPLLISYGIIIDQALGVGILTGILTAGWMIWNAKNPNEFAILGNAPVSEENITGDADDGC